MKTFFKSDLLRKFLRPNIIYSQNLFTPDLAQVPDNCIGYLQTNIICVGGHAPHPEVLIFGRARLSTRVGVELNFRKKLDYEKRRQFRA